MEFVFKVVTRDRKTLGYIQDPLLNLCKAPNNAARFQANSIQDIKAQTKQYQQRLNKVFYCDKIINSPVANIAKRVYTNNYSDFNAGELNIVPENSILNSF